MVEIEGTNECSAACTRDTNDGSENINSAVHEGKLSFLITKPTKTNIFCVMCGYSETEDPSNGSWNPKGKLGITTHFSDIIIQFREKYHTL